MSLDSGDLTVADLRRGATTSPRPPGTQGGRRAPAAGPTVTPTDRSQQRLSEILVEVRDDLGYDTASLFVRGPDGWKLLDRRGPARPWHGVLDPSALEGTPEAAEYPDVRTIPGIGMRLAGLGCSSVSTLPLPDGGRVLLDAERPVRSGGWIERARPYLALVSIMAGPAWPVGGSLGGHGEVAALNRLFTACQAVLARPGAVVDDLLEAAREALHADELFLVVPRSHELEVTASPAGPWPRRIAADDRVDELAGEMEDSDVQRLALAIGASSRALAGGLGREAEDPEIVLVGWSEGPALSPVTTTVAARTISTARAALRARSRAVTTLLDRERTRMAYALHDGLTQTVAGAVLELEALAKRIERDPSEALATVDGSKAEIRKALAELRGMLFDLSRSIEDERPAAEPLTRYIEDVVGRWRLPARVAVEGDLSDLPPRVLSVAYVVIREALANAAKHAAGQNVTVSLAAGDDDLVVIVGDGGRGFTHRDELAAREANHIGLDMLRRRVGEVGGTLRVESRPGKGTRVIAQLPIHEVAS